MSCFINVRKNLVPELKPRELVWDWAGANTTISHLLNLKNEKAGLVYSANSNHKNNKSQVKFIKHK